MKLNEKGWELYNIWEKKYHDENDRLGGDYENGDIVEGWCIIDNREHVKTLTDQCGLLVFGYDDGALWHVLDVIDQWGADVMPGYDFNYTDVARELIQYFEKIDFSDDPEKMRDFRELTKEEFLQSYSYLTEAEYDATRAAVGEYK